MSKCNCEFYAEKLSALGPFFGKSITLDCSEHGHVTIDARPIPTSRTHSPLITKQTGPVFRYCRCRLFIVERHQDDNGNCAKCGKPKDRRIMG